MTTNSIVLSGDSPLLPAFRQVAEASGYGVLGIGELESGVYTEKVDIALELTNLDMEAKRASLATLDRLLPAYVPILASTLGVSATEAASWTANPGRICGFGTFAPLTERNLIEVAPAMQTDAAVLGAAVQFFTTLGKAVEVVEDEAGLVFPRILALIVNEAAFAVMEGTATPENIDIAMKKGTGYPHGPLEWADRIGLDDVLAVIKGLHRDLGEERFRPAPLLRKMVLAGRLGMRTGQGFYRYV